MLTEFSQLPLYNNEFTNQDFENILMLVERNPEHSYATYKE